MLPEPLRSEQITAAPSFFVQKNTAFMHWPLHFLSCGFKLNIYPIADGFTKGTNMKKNNSISRRSFVLGAGATVAGVALGGVTLGSLTGCSTSSPSSSTASSSKIIVISDLHLGADDTYAECVKNRPLLIAFIENITSRDDIDEVVIAGDFLDQWFFPGNLELTADSDEFYREVADNNKTTFDAFKSLMASGTKLVYVPGNHDMTLSADTLENLLPGIVQARDAEGLGTYRTGIRNEIVVEHSHRYELFCAPDALSNKDFMKYGDPILPPGYFYARLGVTSLFEGHPVSTKELPVVPRPASDNADQIAAYTYSQIWNRLIGERFTVVEGFNDPFIKVDVDGFRGEFSLADLTPRVQEDGSISASLYANVQQRWDQIQQMNNVNAPCSARDGMLISTTFALRDTLPQTQYFDLDETVDVVVFGHTHIPTKRDYVGADGSAKIYANSGTWIDSNDQAPGHVGTYVLIESNSDGCDVQVLQCSGEGTVEAPISIA